MNHSILPALPAIDQAALAADILERFGRYVAIETTSDHHAETCPSTPGQWNLARVLQAELLSLGLADARITDHCYVVATLPAPNLVLENGKQAAELPMIGFLAHMDTSSDSSGKDVKLCVHPHYDGTPLVLSSGVVIDPAVYPLLAANKGRTILTSDGTTLLGADDKAGIAEIMAALAWLVKHPQLPRPALRIVFTPDEEIGRGVDKLDLADLPVAAAYTLDGDEDGTYNDQCFSAALAKVKIQGVAIHPGYARGKLVNAVTMAAEFVSRLPRSESPEATDGVFGYYSAQEITGTIEKAEIRIILRDFKASEIQRRSACLHSLAASLEAAWPGSKVEVEIVEQYRNMKEALDKVPAVVDRLHRAIAATGIEPRALPIRGGTDGSRLTAMGIPTPNIFAGGQNFHSVREWVALETMVRSSQVIINLARLWAVAN